MNLTLQIQLLPEPDQARKLRATVERFNEAANWLAGEAFDRKTANKILLQKLCYAELRERFGLSSQMAVRCIAQVCEAYKPDKDKRPGKWFLLVTVDIPDGTMPPTTDFIGVDLGVINIAVDRDGAKHTSEKIEAKRIQYAARRRTLGKATRGAKRSQRRHCHKAIVRSKRKESRYKRDVNHQISKQLVAKAKDTGRGIGMENLKGIRDRTRFRKRQRARMSGWSFAQLRSFVEYKATLAGVAFEGVNPRDSSRTGAECGPTPQAGFPPDKGNRKSRSEFECGMCGHKAHADVNSARVIRLRANAAVNRRMGSEHRLAG